MHVGVIGSVGQQRGAVAGEHHRNRFAVYYLTHIGKGIALVIITGVLFCRLIALDQEKEGRQRQEKKRFIDQFEMFLADS